MLDAFLQFVRRFPLKMIPIACGVLLLAGCADQAGTAAGETGKVDLAAAAAPTGHADVQDAPDSGFCASGEEVVFGCAVGPDRSVAVCATGNFDSVQYREGVRGGPAEVVWPADAATQAPQVFRAGTLMYSGGGGAYLRFDRDGQAWTVYTGVGRGWEQAGVVVEQSGETVRDLACQNGMESAIGPELFKRADIPADPDGFEIPVVSTTP